MRAVLTRTGDYFVQFRDRIKRARAANADLFVSIHADAFVNRDVRGSSVYVLSTRRASSEAARMLADRENAADLIGGVSLHDKSDVLASVLFDLSQNAAISASREAAARVLAELDHVGQLKKSDVQHASLIVLTSPDVPSMLVETAYISNPKRSAGCAIPRIRASSRAPSTRACAATSTTTRRPAAVLRCSPHASAARRCVTSCRPARRSATSRSTMRSSVDELRQRNRLGDQPLASGTILEIPVTGT